MNDETPDLTVQKHILVSPTLGVYLGQGRWSFVLLAGLDQIDSAPTYTSREAWRVVEEWREASFPVIDARPVPVTPDRDDGWASIRCLKQHSVPVWRDE